VLSDCADGEAVVALRPRVVVGAVDPADDVPGSFPVLQGGSQAADLLGGADGVPQQLLVAVVRVVVEVHLVGEQQQCVGVVVGDGVAL